MIASEESVLGNGADSCTLGLLQAPMMSEVRCMVSRDIDARLEYLAMGRVRVRGGDDKCKQNRKARRCPTRFEAQLSGAFDVRLKTQVARGFLAKRTRIIQLVWRERAGPLKTCNVRLVKNAVDREGSFAILWLYERDFAKV